jgi:hypothetical protein
LDEYQFAITNSVAPLCGFPMHPTVYIGWCRCGCFEKGTSIAMMDRSSMTRASVLVEDVESVRDTLDAVTMTSESELDGLAFESRPVLATTAGPEEKPLVVVIMGDGRRLGVTEQHALLLSTGEMVKAVDLTTRDELVDESGAFVDIASIERVYTSADVFNFLTDAGLDPKGHLVIAEGLVVGDIMWQNTLAKQIGDVILRK